MITILGPAKMPSLSKTLKTIEKTTAQLSSLFDEIPQGLNSYAGSVASSSETLDVLLTDRVLTLLKKLQHLTRDLATMIHDPQFANELKLRGDDIAQTVISIHRTRDGLATRRQNNAYLENTFGREIERIGTDLFATIEQLPVGILEKTR